MGDGRVTEQALNVGLAQRHQVTEDDRGEGDQAQHHAYRFAVAHRHVQEQTHHYAEDSDLAGGRQEGGDRRRRPLVNVRRPQVERHQRQFKAKTDDHQTEARQQQRLVQHVVRQAFAQREEGQVAGVRIHQRHTEQQEGRSCRGEDGVFDARFQRTLLAEGVTNQAEQRQRNQLNTEEQRRQMIRTGQQNAAQGGDQHQQVELFFVVLVTLKPRVGESTGREARQQHQTGVKHGVAVNADQRRDVHRPVLADEPERDQRGVKSKNRQRGIEKMIASPRNGEHHNHHRQADDQQR